MMYDIVRKLPDGAQLELVQGPDEGRLSVMSGRSRFMLQALPPQDFPDLTAGELTHRFEIPAKELKALIDIHPLRRVHRGDALLPQRHLPARRRARSRAVLRAVATDGHRLAQAQVECPEGAAGMPGVIIPRKAVLELVKLVEDAEAMVEVALSTAKIRFALDGVVLTSKLIDGTFPDYERVIPQGQRQDHGGRHQAVLPGRRPRLDDLQRKGPGGEAQYRPRQAGAVGQQPRFGLGGGGIAVSYRRRAHRHRLQLALSA
jgi:DNA polymerase III subunit beta